MDGARHDSLAGAGLPLQENRRVHGGHLLHPQEYLPQDAAVTDDLAEVVLAPDLLLQVAVLGLEPVL